jgi:monovalent cation:proton antiporter-2 (CPA2) family protein
MQGEGFFYQAFVYLLAAVISVPIAKRLGLGSVLGYLLAGIVIGPFGIGLIGAEGKDLMHFAEFGVVMMLFLIGLELQPALLWRMRGPILGLGGLQVTITALVIGAIGLGLKLPWQVSLAIGMSLALSSTAIVLQTLNEKNLSRTAAGQNAFSVLLFQDIAFIPIMALMPLLSWGAPEAVAHAASDHGTTWIHGLPVWAQAAAVLGVMSAIALAGRYVTGPIFRFIARTRTREIFTAAALLLVIGIALLMQKIGISPALGAFLAGVVLAGSEYRHEMESDIEPFKGLLLGLFFIAVGASVDFHLIGSDPGLIGGLVALLIVVKLLILLALGRLFKMGTGSALTFAFALAQGGEFAFVLFSFAAQNNVIPHAVAAPLIAVVAVSMALTPLLILLNEKVAQSRLKTGGGTDQASDDIHEENPVIVAGFGRFGNVLGRFLRANGIGVTVLDLDADQVDMLRRLGQGVYYGDASRLDLLQAAGAENAQVIVLAIDSPEKTLEIAESVRKQYPHLKVLARANGRVDAYELLNAGVEDVYRETLDTSLRMGVDVLRMLGHRSHQAVRASHIFRIHDEEDIRELAPLHHDRKQYLSRARQNTRDIERVMKAEHKEEDHSRDAAWDTTSLRQATTADS